MAKKTTPPSRFQAHGTPGEGLVEIVDQETGRSGKIPLSALPTISSLLEDLFESKVTEEATSAPEATSTEQEAAPASEAPAKEEAQDATPQKRKPGRPKKVATDAAAEEKPKRKPGRPKKTATAEEAEAKPKRKPGRPKKVVTPEPEASEAPQEEQVESKPAPKKKTKAAKKPAGSTAPKSGQADGEFEDEVVNEGFKLVRDKELDGVVYDIILDNGEAIGIVEMNEDMKTCMVRPGPKMDEPETSHVSLNGALARIYVDFVIDI